MEQTIHQNQYIQDNQRIFIVPIDILDIPDLTVYEQMAYIVLRSFANMRQQSAFPSYATIAKLGRMSRDAAIKAIQKLAEKGLITKETRPVASKNQKFKNESNVYHFASLHHYRNHDNVDQSEVVVHSDHVSDLNTPDGQAWSSETTRGSRPEQPDLKAFKDFKEFKKIEEEEEEISLSPEIKKVIQSYRSTEKIPAFALDKLVKAVDLNDVPAELLDYVLQKTSSRLKDGKIIHVLNWMVGAIQNELSKYIATGKFGVQKSNAQKPQGSKNKFQRPKVSIIPNTYDDGDQIDPIRLEEIRKKAREYDNRLKPQSSAS